MDIENKSDIDNKITSIIAKLQIGKKDRDDAWSKAISSDIGVLCNFLSTIRSADNDVINPEDLKYAIRIIATIQYAKEAGVVEAKKRTINLSFLRNNSLPPSAAYIENELIIYSFSALANLKENWCLAYICEEIRSTSQRENIKPLTNWLEKLNINLYDQIFNLSTNRPSIYSEADWTILLIEFVTKNVKKDLSKFDKSLVDFLITLVTNRAIDEVKISVLDQINQLSQLNTFILNRVEIASYLTLSRESKSKKSYVLTTQICDRYLTTIIELLKFDLEKNTIENLRNLWMIYESLLNKKDAIKRTNVLAASIASIDISDPNNLAKGIEYLAADLLSAWEELSEATRLDPNSQELFNKLEILKINLNISQYCLRGQSVNYDPIFQEPISKDFVIADKVNIFKPGYFQTRDNGTTKVIKKALISN